MRSAEDSRGEMFEALVNLHRRELIRFAARQLGEHSHLAEDVVQEAFLSAHRAIAAGTCPEHPRAWLFTIVHNAAVNATRGARTTHEIEERWDGVTDGVPAAVEEIEWIGWLMEAVHKLPARQRNALIGHAFEGRSHQEIAARQQTTVSAVKSLLTRARRTLSADALFSALGGFGTPLGALARALRALRLRGLLVGKIGGAKGFAGALTQAALAATVTTGVMMAVHGGSLGSAVAVPVRPHHVGAHHARAHKHDSPNRRAREGNVRREAHRAVHDCIYGSFRGGGRYSVAALQYAARHLSTIVLEYTNCDRQLRSAALRAAGRRHPRRRRPRGSRRLGVHRRVNVLSTNRVGQSTNG